MKEKSRISGEAVKARTGKTWEQWFSILDKIDANKMSHKEIVAHLNKKYKLNPWWQQMITVTYEQDRGMRKKHERPEGYEISVSKTIDVSLKILFKFWSNDEFRRRWLTNESILIHKSTPNKFIKITWLDNKTSIEVNFYDKGKSKSQVVVQHSKLADSNEAERMKLFWQKTLQRLKKIVVS